MDAQLTFTVTNQLIKRTDTFPVVAKSQNYLYAQFTFETPEWDGLTHTAIFRLGDTAYEMILDDNDACLVPHEVLAEQNGHIYVSVFAGSLITANEAYVVAYKSGYTDDLESSIPPTPTVYEQVISRMETMDESIKAIEELTHDIPVFTDSGDGNIVIETVRNDAETEG